MADSRNPKQSQDNTDFPVRLNAKKIAMSLGFFALFLALVSLTAQFIKYVGGVEKAFRLIPTMDVDRELSVPSIFSVQLLFMLAVILAAISIVKYKQNDRFRAQWLVLALGFLFMTFDEGASIHELVVMPIRNWLGDGLPDFLIFAWVIPGMLIILLLAIYYMKFFLSLSKRTKKWILISGAIYLGGLLAMELVGGLFVSAYGIKSLVYNIIVTIEESLEMGGLILAIYTFLDYIEAEFKGIRLDF